jgi:hypothetical protein
MTTIYIYDPKAADGPLPDLPPLPIGALVVAALNLLDQAADLPQPGDIDVSDLQRIDLQFDPAPSSTRAITQWALRFGGVLSSEHHDTFNGPQTWVRARFDYYGVAVTAYAHIPATPATT